MVDFEFNDERENCHWEHFLDGKEMPKGFFDSSYNNDVFPSIGHESQRIQIFFADLDGWIAEFGNDTSDFTKYVLESHESEEIYGQVFEDDDTKHKILKTNDWNEVLAAIEEWRKHNEYF